MEGRKYLGKRISTIEKKANPHLMAYLSRVAIVAGMILTLIFLFKTAVNFSASAPSQVDVNAYINGAIADVDERVDNGWITMDERKKIVDSIFVNSERDCVWNRKHGF